MTRPIGFSAFLKLIELSEAARKSELKKKLAGGGGFQYWRPVQLTAPKAISLRADVEQLKSQIDSMCSGHQREYNKHALVAFCAWIKGKDLKLIAALPTIDVPFGNSGLVVRLKPDVVFELAGEHFSMNLWATTRPTLSVNPSSIVAIVAAVLAFISSILGPAVQLKIGKRQAAAAQASADAAMLAARSAGYREIARLRMEWMSKLRDTLAEYHSMLMSLDGTEKEDESQKLSELGTQLDLMLNQKDKMQKVLWDVADKIFRLEGLKSRQALDEELIEAGRAVFKAEWEKVKAEMRGEPFQTGE